MAREGCVCCPYPLLTIPALLSFIAVVFCWVAAINCNFFSITFVTDGGVDGILTVGLWTVESNFVAYDGTYSWGSYCAGWKNANFLKYYDLDGALKAGRAFGMMSAVLSSISFILILVPACVSFGDSQSYLMSLCVMCVLTGLATLLDLVALASDICSTASSCQLAGAGILAIVGGILWLVIAALMLFALKNPRSFREDTFVVGAHHTATTAPTTVIEQPPAEEKEVRTVQNADGSTIQTTTVTVTNADGSKTVTQTTETFPAP